jgi:hypothetical protein
MDLIGKCYGEVVYPVLRFPLVIELIRKVTA